MLRYLGILGFICLFPFAAFNQEVTGTHDVKPGKSLNEYNIKTTITGLKGVDIARMKYIIDSKHTYKASPNNSLFSDRNEQYIKFYIIAVPATGILNVELGIVVSDTGDYAFPVEFQFSRNEEKQVANFPKIIISGTEAIAMVEEEPKVIEEPKPVPSPVVEEEPEVIEKPKPVATPSVEKEPEVIEEPKPVPLPVVEEKKLPVTEVVSTKYTVQLLSLSEFSQARLNTYCKKHNLPVNKVSKRNVGSVIKVTYGEASSIEDASALKETLVRDYGISDCFVTKIK